MKAAKRIAGMALVMLFFVSVAGPFNGDLHIFIRVFKISRIQSWEAEWPDGWGGITSLRVDGDVTTAFPDGVVFLQTELAPKASASAVIREIRNRVSFGSGNLRAKRISVEDLKKCEMRLDKSKTSDEVQFEKEISSHYRERYGLRVSLKSVEDVEIIMRVSFDAGWSSFGGRLGTSVGGTIFDQTIVFPESKILLVGFSSLEKGRQGAIYWLAISVVRETC